MNHRILLDLQATQSAAHADRGIARYVKEHVRALGRLGVGDALLLNPHLPFPRVLDQDLLTSPALRWATQSEVRRVAEADDRPIAFHLTSPFELSLRGEGDLPPHLVRGDIATIATLYDVIPLVMPERYLPDPVLERRYRARAEQLHHMDLVVCISEHTRRDAIRVLDLDPAKVVTIGFGVSSFFRPEQPGDANDVLLARHVPALRAPFVLAVLGGDPRKNAERLFAAWASEPREHQLVVTCSLDPATRAAWELAAKDVGLTLDDAIVFTGWQPDDVLRALYQRCALNVFPPLYEGAGLPAAEAIACGAPTITSSTSSVPEVLEWPEATFDPESVDEMAALITRALADDDFRSRLRVRGAERAPLLTWDHVARRTVEAYEKLPDTGATTLPVRIALVGPMPPNESGIADYNAHLLPHLARRCELDVFTPTVVTGSPIEGVRWLPPRALQDTCSPWGYDAVVYTVGNSDDHHDNYELAQEFPGLLWLHDVRLPGLYTTYARGRVAATVDFLRERLLRQYRRRTPLHIRDEPDRPSSEYVDFGLGLSKELVDVARGVVVTSEVAARLLRLDQQPDARRTPTWIVPNAFPAPSTDQRPRATASIVSLGVVSPVKGTELLLAAFASLRDRGVDATLTFVGPIDEPYHDHVRRVAALIGVADHVHVTGRVDDATFQEWLATATLAVQLRLATNGESSAAIGGALAAGLPVVTNAHAARELPDGAVALVPWDVDAAGLASRLHELLTSPAQLDALAAAGRAHAATWGFDDVAARIVELATQLP